MFRIIVIVIANLYWRLTACQAAYKVIYMVHGSHKTLFHFSDDETDVFYLKFLKQDSNPGSMLACCNTWHFVAFKKKKEEDFNMERNEILWMGGKVVTDTKWIESMCSRLK